MARAHNSLGVIAAREGRYDEAIGHWRQAVALDPRDFQTLYNLGTLLVKLGRPQEARPYFDAYVRSAPPTVESADLARIKRWLSQ